MKSIISILAIAIVFNLSTAQVPVEVKINHQLKDKAFALNESSTNNLSDQFTVTRLEYYISKISVTHDSGKVTEVSDVYALINPSNPQNIALGDLNITSVEAINFSVGVDPGVNNQDPTQWPINHPLAPKSPSMHWGWSAGYRFVAMEGKSGMDLNATYEIHALGNKNFFHISIPTTSTDNNGTLVIELNADYSEALRGLSIASGLINHGEDGEAKDLLLNFSNEVFSSLSGEKNTLSTEQIPTNVSHLMNAYPNPTNGLVTISLNLANQHNYTVNVVDAKGVTIQKDVKVLANQTAVTLNDSGVYFVSIYEDGALIATKRIIRI